MHASASSCALGSDLVTSPKPRCRLDVSTRFSHKEPLRRPVLVLVVVVVV
jgi:hypothetical protein